MVCRGLIATGLGFAVSVVGAGVENPYGICAHLTLEHRSFEDRRAAIRQVSDLGLGWIRTDFRFWMVQEQQEDAEDWTLLDETLAAVEQHGLKVLPVVWKMPYFQRPILKNQNEWRKWVRKLALRYKDRITAMEIGNEPNVAGFWSEKQFRMADYVSLLKGAYEEIKSIAPSIRVSCAGWAGIPLDKLNEFYACGGGKYCDIISVHPYCDHEFENRPESFLDVQLESLRSLLTRYGDKDKPIWITEIGWPTHIQTLGCPEVLSEGLRLADPNRTSWNVVVVGASPDRGGPDERYRQQIRESLPGDSSVVVCSPRDLGKTIQEEGADAVVFATGKEYFKDAFDAFYDYVAGGGVGAILSHQPLRDEMTYSEEGAPFRVHDGGWGIRERNQLHFEYIAPWHDKTGKVPRGLMVSPRPESSLLQRYSRGVFARSFVGDKYLKGGDRLVPLFSGRHAGIGYCAAGLYEYDSELKGKLIVSTLHDPFFRASSEGRQAKLLTRAMLMARAEGVERIFWYCLSDKGGQGPNSDPQSRFGVVHSDGRAKDASRAYRQVVRMMPSGSRVNDGVWHDDGRKLYWPQWEGPDGIKSGAIWLLGEERLVELDVDYEKLQLLDLFGNPVSYERGPAGAGVRVSVSDSPIYFVGSHLRTIPHIKR